MKLPLACIVVSLLSVSYLSAMSCSTPSIPRDADPPPVDDTASTTPDETVLEAGAVEGSYEGLAPPGCSGPAAGCGNSYCWPNCGVPGQPGGTGAGGNVQQ